jgi:hypothetical protein
LASSESRRAVVRGDKFGGIKDSSGWVCDEDEPGVEDKDGRIGVDGYPGLVGVVYGDKDSFDED